MVNRHIIRILLAIFSGILAFLACSPYGHGGIAYVALIPLFISLGFPIQSSRQAFWTLFIFGLVFMGGMYGWVFSLKAWAPLWGVSLAWMAIIVFQALFYGVVGLFTSWASVRWQLVAFFCFYLGFEWIREMMGPIGSSLGQLGYSQISLLPIMQTASLWGVIGVSGIVVLGNYILFAVGSNVINRSWPSKWVVIAILALIGCGIWGQYRLTSIPVSSNSIRVGIVQGNHPQALKFSRHRQWEIWQDYFRLISTLPPVDIVLLPETVTPGLNLGLRSVMTTLRDLASRDSSTILFGTPVKMDGCYYNSIASVTTEGAGPVVYQKTRLMPFGEYWPCRSLFISLGLSGILSNCDYTKAPALVPWKVGSLVYGPLVCLESIYSECARSHAEQGAQMLLSVANNGWFIGSRISDTHLAMTQSRAIETGLPLIHVSNQGISGMFSNRGVMIMSIPQGIAGVAAKELSLVTKPTFFVKVGYYFAPVLLVIGALLIAIKKRD